MPRAFMVNAPEREVDLIPDWLKLKMIRSEVPPLVDAALVELDPGKLVLFIQSFGIPVPRYVSFLVTILYSPDTFHSWESENSREVSLILGNKTRQYFDDSDVDSCR